jgi:LPXTG-motif cell wall-anchored protein
MMSMLDAAIARAENPNFRVASAAGASSMHLSEIHWSDTQETASAPSTEVAAAPTTREWHEVTIEHENLPARNQVAQADTTTTTTTTEETVPAPERMGAANLPQTGGDPGLLYMFGSGMMGLGGLLLRKRRS